MNRSGFCVLAPLGGCWGPLDAHELVRRSQMKDPHLQSRMVVKICRKHHDMVDDQPMWAQSVGVHIKGWAWRQYGEEALAEAARLRIRVTMSQEPELPFWEEPPEGSES